MEDDLQCQLQLGLCFVVEHFGLARLTYEGCLWNKSGSIAQYEDGGVQGAFWR
jgi:hypothetical protein